jgi:hypothetical protein
MENCLENMLGAMELKGKVGLAGWLTSFGWHLTIISMVYSLFTLHTVINPLFSD